MQKISEVGHRPLSWTIRCPKCRGTSFHPRRSSLARVLSIATLGLATMFAPKSRVKCVTCGTSFKRR